MLKKCRDTRIRTWDPLLPKQVRYRTALHPEKEWQLLQQIAEKTASCCCYCHSKLRRVRDSNPRYELTPYDGLANRWFQPLTQLSRGRAKSERKGKGVVRKSPNLFCFLFTYSFKLILIFFSSSATVSLKIRSVSIISCTALQE